MTNDGIRSAQELHGWKEIARYMGRSVRAVQRWEQDLGLPVRRLKTAAGQVVFATAADLDAWRARNEIGPGPESQPEVAPLSSAAASKTSIRLAAVAVLAVIAIGVAAAGMLRRPVAALLRAAPVPAAEFRLAGNALEALDGSGAIAWRHTFTEALAPWPASSPRHLLRQVMRADVDGDGHREVLVVTPLEPSPFMRSDRVSCFREDGTLLWTYDPTDVTLSFRSETFVGSWHVQDVAISPPPGRQRIWVALGHHTWWPSAVVELDPGGKSAVRFVQSGAVYTLAIARVGNRLRLFAGGINNEYGAAGFAVLDPDTAASSPQTQDSQYQCTSCVPQQPLEYVVLPRSDINLVGRLPYNRVGSIHQTDEGTLLVTSVESFDPGTAMLYRFNIDGSVRDVAPTDGYWGEHRKYVAAGLLSDAEEKCPARRPQPLRVWTAAEGWRQVAARPAGAPAPAPHRRD
jgi:hypothetical protein